jgi:hypothetical protein
MVSAPGVDDVTAPRTVLAAIGASAMVPALVIVPPDRPVPAVMLVTPPPPDPLDCTHWTSTTWVLSGMAEENVSTAPDRLHVFADWWMPSNDTMTAAAALGVEESVSVVVDPAVKFVPARKSCTTAVPAPPPALIVTHPNPTPSVHVSAWLAPTQDGTAMPVGGPAVSADKIVLAD